MTQQQYEKMQRAFEKWQRENGDDYEAGHLTAFDIFQAGYEARAPFKKAKAAK